MDQLPQATPTPIPPEQPNPRITLPQATPVLPTSSPSAAPTSPSSSKLKNPKLWIAAGVALLIIVVGSAFFLGKPRLFTGKIEPPEDERRAAPENCSILSQEKCNDPSRAGICEWITAPDGTEECQAVGTPSGAEPAKPEELPQPEPAPPQPEPAPPQPEPAPLQPEPAPPQPEPAPQPPEIAPPEADLNQIRNTALDKAQQLMVLAAAAAQEAASQAETINSEDARRAANQAQVAAAAAEAAAERIKTASTEAEIFSAIDDVQAAYEQAEAARNTATALANAIPAEPEEPPQPEPAPQPPGFTPPPEPASQAAKKQAKVANSEEARSAANKTKRQACASRPGFEWTGAACVEKEKRKLETEKLLAECKGRDQNVWEWDQGMKVCKNKLETRIHDLENLVASFQTQLAAAQSANNNEQINALNTQIAALIAEMNNLQQATGQPVVVNVVTPPAPAPMLPAAPDNGEIVAVVLPSAAPSPAPALPVPTTPSSGDSDPEEVVDIMTAESASVSAPAVSAPAVPDSGGAAAAAASATPSYGTAVASSTSDAATAASTLARATHGVFIQGRTGPGMLLYPILVAAANSACFWLKKKK